MRNLWTCGTICIGLIVLVACSENPETNAGDNEVPECCQVGTSRATLFSPTVNSETTGISIPQASTPPSTKP